MLERLICVCVCVCGIDTGSLTTRTVPLYASDQTQTISSLISFISKKLCCHVQIMYMHLSLSNTLKSSIKWWSLRRHWHCLVRVACRRLQETCSVVYKCFEMALSNRVCCQVWALFPVILVSFRLNRGRRTMLLILLLHTHCAVLVGQTANLCRRWRI